MTLIKSSRVNSASTWSQNLWVQSKQLKCKTISLERFKIYKTCCKEKKCYLLKIYLTKKELSGSHGARQAAAKSDSGNLKHVDVFCNSFTISCQHVYAGRRQKQNQRLRIRKLKLKIKNVWKMPPNNVWITPVLAHVPMQSIFSGFLTEQKAQRGKEISSRIRGMLVFNVWRSNGTKHVK